MNTSARISRRSSITALATAVVGVWANAKVGAVQEGAPTKLKGLIHHSVCKWCYKMPLEDLCREAKAMGLESIELLGPKEWPILKKYGLTCAMASGAGMGIAEGFNHVENHDKLVESFTQVIPQVTEAGLTNLICMSGNRKGLDDEKGIENCVTGLKKLMKLAEEKKVTLVMELLNSKVNHKDYQCDHTAWGVEVVKRVGSERLKLLYDIYHMQIMEGDVCHTIKDNIQYIAHFHTGGVPGRNEIDDAQELNYRHICEVIAATGFKGFVGQEFLPTRDPMTSLRQAIQICDV